MSGAKNILHFENYQSIYIIFYVHQHPGGVSLHMASSQMGFPNTKFSHQV